MFRTLYGMIFSNRTKNEWRKVMSEREEKFEKMLQAIQMEYDDTLTKMEQLKAAGRIKTATYRQLMGTKITLQNMLSRYEIYGLLER